MFKFTIFHQNQYGVYTADMCADGNLGTCHVGPCVALFLYNHVEKSCFAMHIDSTFSFQLIFDLIEKNFESPEILRNFEAFIVGGWQYPYTDENGKTSTINSIEFDIEALLKTLGIKSVSKTLYKLQPKIKDTSEGEFYDVILNLNDGKIMLYKHEEHDLEAQDPRSPDEIDLYEASCKYLEGSCLYPLTLSLHTLRERNPEYLIYDETFEFLEEIIDQNDGVSAIPAHNISERAEQEIEMLADMINSGNPLAVIKQLYLNFASPKLAPPEWNGDTCLHFACRVLEADPNNFYLKINVVFLILYAKFDFKNDLGVEALDELINLELQNFKDICKKLLRLFKIYEDNDEVNAHIVHWYRIFAITTVNNIFYCLANESGIPECESEFLNQLNQKAKPEYWIEHSNKIQPVLCIHG